MSCRDLKIKIFWLCKQNILFQTPKPKYHLSGSVRPNMYETNLIILLSCFHNFSLPLAFGMKFCCLLQLGLSVWSFHTQYFIHLPHQSRLPAWRLQDLPHPISEPLWNQFCCPVYPIFPLLCSDSVLWLANFYLWTKTNGNVTSWESPPEEALFLNSAVCDVLKHCSLRCMLTCLPLFSRLLMKLPLHKKYAFPPDLLKHNGWIRNGALSILYAQQPAQCLTSCGLSAGFSWMNICWRETNSKVLEEWQVIYWVTHQSDVQNCRKSLSVQHKVRENCQVSEICWQN